MRRKTVVFFNDFLQLGPCRLEKENFTQKRSETTKTVSKGNDWNRIKDEFNFKE